LSQSGKFSHLTKGKVKNPSSRQLIDESGCHHCKAKQQICGSQRGNKKMCWAAEASMAIDNHNDETIAQNGA